MKALDHEMRGLLKFSRKKTDIEKTHRTIRGRSIRWLSQNSILKGHVT